MSESRNLKIVGRSTSPGLVIGPAFVYHDRPDKLSPPRAIGRNQVEEELSDIERAVRIVRGDLKISAQRIEAQTGPKLAAIFDAHEEMLQDPSLRREIRDEVEGTLIDASQALARVFLRWEEKFRATGEEILKDRADDLIDLQGRLLREIAGVKTTALEKMPPGRVLVASRLFPSDTVALPRRGVLGIILEFGGPGSHAALLARALGIPTVALIPNATERIADAQEVIVDAFAGEVILSPDAATRSQYEESIRMAQEESLQARHLSMEPVRTTDGKEVAVMANVGCGEDITVAVENGADGIGLYRIEQFYLARNTPPSVAELLTELRGALAPFHGKMITIRLLDLGADKPVPFVQFPSEDDPFLGRRGVRLLLQYPDLLDVQLKALLELAREHDVHILVPMVTLAGDMERVRRRLREIADAAGISRLPPLGAMIETPAAALCVAELIPHSDFFSIGTNDLTQFTMAAGRENPLVNDYFLEDHPAVLRLVRIVLDEAGQTPVSVCGELAADLKSIPSLLKLGLRSLSVAPPLAPAVKEAIRRASSG
ncbi:MAG: phosphoenolpyruvate--protein phosphotransferase [Verrucomicrobiaceae bacterium]|nr:MAG: phosphoenolpyruvate--protein phosphotransferase [Verrucomicrobiaceae bacterium]